MSSTARRLRTASTDVERKLWNALRNRQLEGVKFRRQVPIDRFVVDFASIEKHLVIELDGGQHALQEEADSIRTKILESSGFTVLRFWNNELVENFDGVLEAIRLALNVTSAPP